MRGLCRARFPGLSRLFVLKPFFNDMIEKAKVYIPEDLLQMVIELEKAYTAGFVEKETEPKAE